MRRGGLSIKRKTSMAQKLPEELTHKITLFQQYIIQYRNNINNNLQTIGNMDETPLWFDMPIETTVDIKGIQIKHT